MKWRGCYLYDRVLRDDFKSNLKFYLKYIFVARAITRVTYAIVDAISLLELDLRVALASANAPLRIPNTINKGSIHLIVCDDSKILIVTRLSKKAPVRVNHSLRESYATGTQTELFLRIKIVSYHIVITSI